MNYLRYFVYYILCYLATVGMCILSYLVTAVEIFSLKEKNKCSLAYFFYFRYISLVHRPTRQMSCALSCHNLTKSS